MENKKIKKIAPLTLKNGWKINENFGCCHSLVHMMQDTIMQ
jgi:hypothetical protein